MVGGILNRLAGGYYHYTPAIPILGSLLLIDLIVVYPPPTLEQPIHGAFSQPIVSDKVCC